MDKCITLHNIYVRIYLGPSALVPPTRSWSPRYYTWKCYGPNQHIKYIYIIRVFT